MDAHGSGVSSEEKRWPMCERVEIHVVVPKEMKIQISKELLEEFDQAVRDRDLSTVIMEALGEELKKLRFRSALQTGRRKLP